MNSSVTEFQNAKLVPSKDFSSPPGTTESTEALPPNKLRTCSRVSWRCASGPEMLLLLESVVIAIGCVYGVEIHLTQGGGNHGWKA